MTSAALPPIRIKIHPGFDKTKAVECVLCGSTLKNYISFYDHYNRKHRGVPVELGSEFSDEDDGDDDGGDDACIITIDADEVSGPGEARGGVGVGDVPATAQIPAPVNPEEASQVLAGLKKSSRSSSASPPPPPPPSNGSTNNVATTAPNTDFVGVKLGEWPVHQLPPPPPPPRSPQLMTERQESNPLVRRYAPSHSAAVDRLSAAIAKIVEWNEKYAALEQLPLSTAQSTAEELADKLKRLNNFGVAFEKVVGDYRAAREALDSQLDRADFMINALVENNFREIGRLYVARNIVARKRPARENTATVDDGDNAKRSKTTK